MRKLHDFKIPVTVCLVALLLMLPVIPVHATSSEKNPGSLLSVAGLLKSSTQIIEEAKDLNGNVIVYQGEIIGDIMKRGDHVWVNLTDGTNAIGIWLSAEQALGVTVAGRYDARGDILRVTGTFNRSCSEHGGDYDIHPMTVELMEPGYPIRHPLKPWLVFTSLGLLMGAVFVLLTYQSRRHRVVEKWSVKMMTPAGIRLRLR